jgi:serine/threonine protein kinase
MSTSPFSPGEETKTFPLPPTTDEAKTRTTTVPEPVPATRPPDGPMPATPAAGPSVEDYEILGELGRGGMGVVYKARHKELNRLVALKMILAGGHACAADLERFQIEALAVARLQHPNIVQIYDIGEQGGLPFFSLEYCSGGSLAAKLDGTPLPGRQAAALVEKLARAMEAAHRAKIIHRDLKPANVLLAADGEPKITDFGLAKRLDAAGQTQSGSVMGTPSYMAPEQARGRIKDIGPATDVYQLGAVLYELLTGRPPFKAATPLETVLQVTSNQPVPPRLLNSHMDADLERVTLKCLEKEPALRYGSAAALAEDLRHFLEGEPVSARSIHLLERLQRELSLSQHDAQLRPWGTGLLVLGLLIFLAHLTTSSLLSVGCLRPAAFWGPRIALLAALVPLLRHFRSHAPLWPTNAVERIIWATWGGYLLAFASMFGALTVMGHDHLEVYGVAAGALGLAWFVMGGSVWGGCYLLGGLCMLLAPAMALLAGSSWAPSAFGALWGGTLALLGLRYRRLGKGAE